MDEMPRSGYSNCVQFSVSSPQQHESEILEEAKRAQRRCRIKAELFTTEKAYLRHLELVHKYFDFPLRFNCLISDRTHALIFSNIEQISEVNRHLLTHMEQGSIGSAFLYLAPFLKFYSTYANNHESALEKLQECVEKDVKFCEFLRVQECLPELSGLKLNALLITPVQRIPRYKLLLEDLLNNTPESHHDYIDIKEAVSKINELATYINEQIRYHDHFHKMLAIQKSLVGSAPRILTPGRGFIKQGWLKKISRRGRKVQDRMFYLFTDMLIYAKAKNSDNEQFTVCAVYPLRYCCVQRLFGSCSKTVAHDGLVFKVTCRDDSVLVYSSNPKTCQIWIDSLLTAISDIRGPNGLERRSTRRKTIEQNETTNKRPKLRSSGSPCSQPIRKQLANLTQICRSPQASDCVVSPRLRPKCVESPINCVRRSPFVRNCVASPRLRCNRMKSSCKQKDKLADQIQNVEPIQDNGLDNPAIDVNNSFLSQNSHKHPQTSRHTSVNSRDNCFPSRTSESYSENSGDSFTDASFREDNSSQSYVSYESCDYDSTNHNSANETDDKSSTNYVNLSNYSDDEIFHENPQKSAKSDNINLREELRKKYAIKTAFQNSSDNIYSDNNSSLNKSDTHLTQNFKESFKESLKESFHESLKESFQDSFVLVDEGLSSDNLNVSLDMFAAKTDKKYVPSGVKYPRYDSYKQAHCMAHGDEENQGSTLERFSQTVQNSVEALRSAKQDNCSIQ